MIFIPVFRTYGSGGLLHTLSAVLEAAGVRHHLHWSKYAPNALYVPLEQRAWARAVLMGYWRRSEQ